MKDLTAETRAEILHHAALEYPNECCGLLVESDKTVRYTPCRNISKFPSESFEIHPDDWILAESLGEVIAIVHSHTDGNPYLSAPDRLMQQEVQLPWVLAVGEQLTVVPFIPLLRGRVFDYGKSDCYTLVSDAYRLAGLDLMHVERSTLDEDRRQKKFLSLASSAGFYPVDTPAAGDVLLTAYRGEISHAAIYLGQGQILHHECDMLSRVEPYSLALQRVTKSIWRHKGWKPEMIQAILNDLYNSL